MLKRRFSRMFRIVGEVGFLITEHKFYFLAPILLAMAILSLLFYKIGPTILISFLYAGV